MTARARALAERIDRVALDPDSIHAPFLRLARPILATFGFTPVVSAKETVALVKLARQDPSDAELRAAIAKAWTEMEENVRQVERAAVLERRPHVSHGAWLRRLLSVIERTEAMAAGAEVEEDAVRVIAATEPVRLLPPLVVRSSAEGDDPSARDADLAELQLGMVDHLLAAAIDETDVLGRKQRLLEAARQILLETQAALPLDDEGVRERQRWIARALARVNRLRAAGLRANARLLHQAREALSRGERDRLQAALAAMHAGALARGDREVAEIARAALDLHCPDRGAVAARESCARSIGETLGADVERLVHRAMKGAREKYANKPKKADGDTLYAYDAAKQVYAEGAEVMLLRVAFQTSGRIEVGGPLSPVQITEHESRARAVRFPTQDLVLLPATEPSEIPSTVIEDPRTILLSLAAGRLLARRFVHHELHEKKRTILRGEVRVYLLDGSGSMIGARSRVRDAILLAELATLRARCLTASASVVLFYRYFTEKLGPVQRVAKLSEVEAAIADVVGTVRTGGTNISAALFESMDHIRAAKASDPELARAQIVLVTDGEAPVDEEELAHRREQIGSMPVGLSVIALGEENPALRAIVARQRAKGEHAFYHFIDDATLEAMVAGAEDDDLVLHVPPDRSPPDARELEALLDEMAALGKRRDTEALEVLDAHREALAEVGLAELARASVLYKDQEALDRLFLRWFPRVEAGAGAGGRDASTDAALVVLATITEVVSVVGGSPEARKADALELLERLLPDARLSPARWDELTRAKLAVLAPALRALHAAVAARG